MHTVCLQLLGLVLAKSCGGCGGRPWCCCGDGLLHRVAVAPRCHVAGGGSGRSGVGVLLIGGRGGRVLGVRSSGVVDVGRSGSSGCCGLHVGNYHSGLHKSLWIDIVSWDPVERWERESEVVGESAPKRHIHTPN